MSLEASISTGLRLGQASRKRFFFFFFEISVAGPADGDSSF